MLSGNAVLTTIQKLRHYYIYKTYYDDHGKRFYIHCVVARERLLFWVENKTLKSLVLRSFVSCSNKRVFGSVRNVPVSLHRNHLIVDTQWFHLLFEVEFEFM